MRQFVAMLRDSYKEAVDGWIFFVMLALAGVVIVLVGSMSVDPLPPEDAVPKALRGQAMQIISADRGVSPKLAIFTYSPNVSDVQVVRSAADPWDATVRFTIEYRSLGFGPSGVEVDDAKKPKDVKKIEGQDGFFSDAFKDAVRYWAGRPGEPRPPFTEELAAEFVTAQVRDVAQLNVAKVERDASKPAAVVGPAAHAFAVTAEGGRRVGWVHRPSLFFGLVPISVLDQPLGESIHLLEDTLVNGLGAWVVLLAGVVVTSGFIPNMLRKGAIDLLLTKPMSRPAILLYKYLGGLLFVFLLTVVTVGGVWVAVGLRTGVWSPGLLYSIAGITFYFAILYACSTMVGVLTRNAIVSIVVTVVFWFTVFLIGFVNNLLQTFNNIDFQQPRPAAKAPADPGKKGDAPPEPEPTDDRADRDKVPQGLLTTFRILDKLTPRTNDLDKLTSRLIGRDLLSPATQRQAGLTAKPIDLGEVFAVASAYIAFFLGVAMLRFVTRSY